jgi:SSS family solute:Na+ symporter
MKYWLLLISFNLIMESTAQKAPEILTFKWDTLAILPDDKISKPNIGVAGPVAGIVGDMLIVAGGANFPENPPWTGGKKKYHDKIYILKKKEKNHYHWVEDFSAKLNYPIAYPANVPYKRGFICVGGENDNGVLKSVIYFQWLNENLNMTLLPELPIGLTSCSAVCIKDRLYVVGGNSGKTSLKSAFVMDLSKTDKKWTAIGDMPFALENSVAAVGHDGESQKIFLLGGRFKLPDDKTTTFSDKVLKYDPKSNKWSTFDFKNENGEKLKLAAGTGVAISKSKIVIVGGDKGIIFNKIESFNNKLSQPDLEDREKVNNEKIALLTSHIGFDTDMYIFDANKNIWQKSGSIPGLAQVTTSAFYWGKSIIIPGGEIKPGIRTPMIRSIKIRN